MLRLGSNQYELVRVHSGFSVTLLPPGEDFMKRDQVWELEACYIPSEHTYTPRADGELEYLKVAFRCEDYAVKDWRQLSGFGLDTDTDKFLVFASVENALLGRFEKESWGVIPGWLEVERTNGYLFHCTFNGFRKLPDGTEEEMEFTDEIPFSEATAYVPINAADPEATAKTMAARAVGLTEGAVTKIHRYDPQKKSYLGIRINTHHRVTLRTPWRQQLA
jgi:hypothetical protein